MNTFVKLAVMSTTVLALVASSALPASAQERRWEGRHQQRGWEHHGNNGPALVVGILGLAAVAALSQEHSDDGYQQPPVPRQDYDGDGNWGRRCWMRVVEHHYPTYNRDFYGHVFQTSSGYDIVQDTCTGETRTRYW